MFKADTCSVMVFAFKMVTVVGFVNSELTLVAIIFQQFYIVIRPTHFSIPIAFSWKVSVSGFGQLQKSVASVAAFNGYHSKHVLLVVQVLFVHYIACIFLHISIRVWYTTYN